MTNPSPEKTLRDEFAMADISAILNLAEGLGIKADMINMGERIQLGSETELMRQAGEVIRVLATALKHYQKRDDSLERDFRGGGAYAKDSVARSALTRAAAIAKGERDGNPDYKSE